MTFEEKMSCLQKYFSNASLVMKSPRKWSVKLNDDSYSGSLVEDFTENERQVNMPVALTPEAAINMLWDKLAEAQNDIVLMKRTYKKTYYRLVGDDLVPVSKEMSVTKSEVA